MTVSLNDQVDMLGFAYVIILCGFLAEKRENNTGKTYEKKIFFFKCYR